MTPQAQLIMLAWLPIVFYLFKIYAPRKAVAWALPTLLLNPQVS